jgi:outer membrane protein TolC
MMLDRMYRRIALALFSALPLALPGLLAAAEPAGLSLPRAIEIALSANRNLAISRLNFEGEQRGLDAARAEFELKIVPTTTIGRLSSNAFAPTATGNNSSIGAQLAKKFETGTLVSIGPSWNRSGDTTNQTLNVSVQQPLLKGFGSDVNLDGVHRAQFSIASAGRALDQARVNTALETIATYYDVIKQEKLAELNDALAERLRRHAIVARSKERVGVATPMDTYRAQIYLKDAEDGANQARNAHQAAKNQLKLVLNLNLDSDLRLAAPPAPELRVQNVELEAVRQRAELVQLRAEIEEATRAMHVAANALLPDVSLRWNYGQAVAAQPVFAQFLPTTQRQSSVYLQAGSDLFRTAEKANFRRTELRLESLRVSLESKSADIRRQVRQQLALLDEAKRRIVLRQEQIRQAEGKLALAEVKFAHDMADNFAVIEAEGERQRARANLLATEAEHAIGIYNLEAISGHLLDAFPEKLPRIGN